MNSFSIAPKGPTEEQSRRPGRRSAFERLRDLSLPAFAKDSAISASSPSSLRSVSSPSSFSSAGSIRRRDSLSSLRPTTARLFLLAIILPLFCFLVLSASPASAQSAESTQSVQSAQEAEAPQTTREIQTPQEDLAEEIRQAPPLPAPDALRSCLSGDALLSASEQDLAANYLSQLDRTVILCFQASYSHPGNPDIWKTLAMLSETKSFFAADPEERAELMEEAAAHFGHSARLEFERLNELPFSEEDAQVRPSVPADPFLSELFWDGRLRRGEVSLNELRQRHAAENLDPTFRPEFWRERALLLLSIADPEKRAAEIAAAKEEFSTLWSTMPVEVPWQGVADKFGPQKLKKVEVLEAWASSLIFLSSQEKDPDASRTLFLDALAAYAPALKLPLDSFELDILATKLNQADVSAPDNDCLLALWTLEDSLYARRTENFPDLHDIWAAWGQEFYERALKQTDSRVFASYFKSAGEKYQRYAAKHPSPGTAYADWGDLLEFKIFPALAYLSIENPEDRHKRTLDILNLAQESYRKAFELEPERLTVIKALSRLLLKLSAYKGTEELDALLEESERLSLLAIGRDPNSALAWLQRGLDCLDFQSAGQPPAPEAREKLTAAAFAAFHQHLLSNSVRAENLRSIADKVWQAAESLPSQRRPGLILLADVCRRLIALEPLQPDYRFALGLTLFSLLADSPNWPDDLVFSSSPEAKEAFQEILESYETGLELLSDMDAGSPSSFPGESPQTASFPRPWGWPTPQSREFLSADPPPGAVLSSSTFQEKLGTILKMELNRLVALAEPELLPPWHQLKLASFFRRAAASGYPPPLDQMAFFRLADFYLTKAQNGLTDARASLADVARDAVGLLNKTPVAPSLLAQIHAERALLLAEISLLSPKDAEFLLSRSESLWRLAEEESPGSSRYSKARWAAWNSDKETLIPFLAHTAAEQENLLWPSFREALFEPAFKNLRESHWFKAAWFGYSR